MDHPDEESIEFNQDIVYYPDTPCDECNRSTRGAYLINGEFLCEACMEGEVYDE